MAKRNSKHSPANQSASTSLPAKQRPEAVQITDAEWEVMSLLWVRSPLSATQVSDELASARGWKHTTIKTLLSRLVEKRAVEFVQNGREYLYSPRVQRSDAVRAQSGSFISRFFGGALAPMVAHFIDEHNISNEEITRLKQLLDNKANELNAHGKEGR